ncbi:hypothetical protein SCANM63S_09475 [Streptomyces canarius]
MTSPIRSVDSGHTGEGLSTTVFPASSAGAILTTDRMTGKFDGATAATTPRGTRSTTTSAPASSAARSGGPRVSAAV